MYNPSNFWGALQRGWGCVTPEHSYPNSKQSLKPRKRTSKQLLCPARIPHRNTPIYPLSRWENQRHKFLIINKKTASQTSPLERGWGCVTSEHSYPKYK